MNIPCFVDGCPNTLTVTIAGRYRPAQGLEEAESPDLSATGCPAHVNNASHWEWVRPGGIAARLWPLVDGYDLDLFDAEVERRIQVAREGTA